MNPSHIPGKGVGARQRAFEQVLQAKRAEFQGSSVNYMPHRAVDSRIQPYTGLEVAILLVKTVGTKVEHQLRDGSGSVASNSLMLFSVRIRNFPSSPLGDGVEAEKIEI